MFPRTITWEEFLSRREEFQCGRLVIKRNGEEYATVIDEAILAGDDNDKLLSLGNLEDAPEWIGDVGGIVFNRDAGNPFEYGDGRIVFVNEVAEVTIHLPLRP